MEFKPFFLPVAGGRRFCLYYSPSSGTAKAGVLYLHPFAEEMNKSRRMVSLQARALAEQGYAVLQIDLHGCGDSSDDFGDATWAGWQDDVITGYEWLRNHVGAQIWLWGLRIGCLLAASTADRLREKPNLLFWQPVVSGKQFLQQFFRLRLAGNLQSSGAKESTEDLRNQLASGEAVEVAGYRLGPRLAAGIDAAELIPTSDPRRVIWLELSARAGATMTPAAQKRIAQWQAAGHNIQAQLVSGPAFWQTAEIEVVPTLIEATTAAIDSVCP
jgi:exosortase A-associated hydrolase 2